MNEWINRNKPADNMPYELLILRSSSINMKARIGADKGRTH